MGNVYLVNFIVVNQVVEAKIKDCKSHTLFNLFWYFKHAVATLTNGLWGNGGVECNGVLEGI